MKIETAQSFRRTAGEAGPQGVQKYVLRSHTSICLTQPLTLYDEHRMSIFSGCENRDKTQETTLANVNKGRGMDCYCNEYDYSMLMEIA